MKFITYSAMKHRFWFRIFGYGISGKNVKTHGLVFSERIGKRKRIQIFGWSFTWLKRNNF